MSGDYYSLSESIEGIRQSIREAWKIYEKTDDDKVKLKALWVVQKGERTLRHMERLAQQRQRQ
jgi:hypothetical protein